MIDARVLLSDPVVTPVFVRIDDRPFGGYCFSKNALTSRLVAMADHPAALFARLATDNMNDCWPVIVVGSVAGPLIRAPTRWIGWVVMRRTFFPGVVVNLIHLERLAIHQVGWRVVVQIGLQPLSQRMDGLARELEFAGQARGRFTLADAAQQEHQRGRPLTRAFKGSAAQQGIVAITCATAVGIIVALRTEMTALGTPTVRADEAVRMQVPLQPEQTEAIVKQVCNRKVNHGKLTQVHI
jgi:hypothetical protein